MLHSPLVPAIIPRDLSDIESCLRKLGPVSEIHLDVVDGGFVPFTSWPYQPTGREQDVHELLSSYTLEVDLMVQHPYEAAVRWVAAGADMLVFHIETITPTQLELFAHEYSVTVGISLNADTPIEALLPYVSCSDYVQIMGIAQIGAQGQPFDMRTLVRIDEARMLIPTHFVSVDGSVNADTIPLLKPHLPDRYIVGSAIVKQSDPQYAYQRLTQLWSSTGLVE